MRVPLALATVTLSLAIAPAAEAAPRFSACMVTDAHGIDDRAFNAETWKGLKDARAKTGMKISYVTSRSYNSYLPNLKKLARSKKCRLIVTVGDLMSPATSEASKKFPKQKFLIVDANFKGGKVHGLQYNVAQSAFLAGYLAAGTSKTGKVGTFGALNVPPITVYMDGFWEGVQYYNKKNAKKVKVLGWNEKTRQGSFSFSFEDREKGKDLTRTLISQGADIVLPVAGNAGLGAVAAARESEGKVQIIWPDTDARQTLPRFDAVLTSIVKNIRGTVRDAVTRASKRPLKGTTIGTLANKGTALAPDTVPTDLAGDLDKIAKAITTGTIKITSSSQPRR